MPVQTLASRRRRGARSAIHAAALRFVASTRNPAPPGTISVSSSGAFATDTCGTKPMPDSLVNARFDSPITLSS